MSIVNSTEEFEAWLKQQMELNTADLNLKHEQMAGALFPFFRATFYRWTQKFPKLCDEAADAPELLSVGDLHVENFGTWRDIEGRLVWGINDFDEACALPYTNDLVRLAASASVAIETQKLSLGTKTACNAILKGYEDALKTGGKPFVLAENTTWLRDIATQVLKDPVVFWNKLTALPKNGKKMPNVAAELLDKSFPEKLEYRTVPRTAGLGSLGLPRFVGFGPYRGGMCARQVKALAKSACAWADEKKKGTPIHYTEITGNAIHSPDFTIKVENGWIARRLAPDCRKIELSAMPEKEHESLFLEAMGGETANVHLGSKKAIPDVLKDLAARNKKDADWLINATKTMLEQLRIDHKEWKKHMG